MKSAIRAVVWVAVAASIMLAAVGFPPSAAPKAEAGPDYVPIVFVHGFVGSGAQYQSQAMRFASNGYPADHIRAFDYNSLDSSLAVVGPLLDDFIDGLLAELGGDEVYVAGHSLGTSVMQGYLNSSTARADRVGKYINLDGATATAEPGGVPTLAIWGAGDPIREVVGADNVYFPAQTHTQVVTSPESFAEQYEFLVGSPPATTDIVPEANIEIGGRAIDFPINAGWDGATIEVWEVDSATGARTGATPEASYLLGPDGAWGPFAGSGSQHYELVLIRDDAGDHHFYFQTFTRSNYLIRLLSAEPDSVIADNIDSGPNHTTVTILRYKEFWGDGPGGENDTLEVNGTNVINAATSPVSNRTIGIFLFDSGSDGVTDLSEPDDFFFPLPFQTGMDIYMAAASPPDGTICFENAPRGDNSNMQVVNIPNWRSDENTVTIEFTDYVHEGDPACAAPPPVGGIALDGGAGLQPLSDAGSSNRSFGVFPWAVAAATAAAVALAGAALWVRNRRMRRS